MAIKGAKTIAEYRNLKIMEWLENNFVLDSLTVEFMDSDGGTAKITDKNGDTAYVVYRKGKITLEDELEVDDGV